MCATAVLRSQGCLRKPNRHSPTNNSNVSRSRRRKNSLSGFDSTNVPDRSRVTGCPIDHRKSPLTSVAAAAAATAKNNLVMGQVKILKRGERLPDHSKNDNDTNKLVASKTATFKNLGLGGKSDEADDLILCSTGRLGPEPELVQKHIRASDFYSGSGPIVASPPPSSLPLPAFFSKKEKKIDEATSDLLRLLRLDLH